MLHRSIIIAAIAAFAVAVALFVTWRDLDLFASQQCEKPGDPCCSRDSEVKIKHCHQGLGCNVATGKCEACGAPGQPCCDGDFTGFSLKGYTGVLLDTKERIESCNIGAICDARLAADGRSWEGTRLCQACGRQEGGSCCGPDVRYALGRCFTDAVSQKRLTCHDPWAGAQGTCVSCGSQVNEIACMDRRPCDTGLVEDNGVCVFCGQVGQPVCDYGEPCRDQAVPNKSYTMCVAAGGANQPCLKNGACGYHGMFCNDKKICELCGDGGQTCCPPATGDPACRVGECVEGRCFICGYENNPVCPGADPCPNGGEPVNAMCRPCGRENQVCCRSLSIRCHDGMSCKDSVCKRPGGGSGSGEQWKTCSGQPYTWSTQARPIFVEDDNGCSASVTYIASSPEEALQCARGQYGEAAIGPTVQPFSFAVSCLNTGCNQVTLYGKNQSSAQDCAEAFYVNCEVESGTCSP